MLLLNIDLHKHLARFNYSDYRKEHQYNQLEIVKFCSIYFDNSGTYKLLFDNLRQFFTVKQQKKTVAQATVLCI